MSKPLIHDHDGHVDDMLSCMLLWLSDAVDLLAVGVTNGDCYADQAFEALVKIATFLDLEGTELAMSDEEMPHPFPDNWRRESYIINELPVFSANDLKKPYQQGKCRRTETVFSDCLLHSRRPVTIVTTAPLTNVAAVLREQPDFKRNIEEFVIMGGAINVPGNVEEPGHDGTAEWNIYADPQAFKTVMDTGVPIKLITLDVTNELPVTTEWLHRLDDQAYNSRASLLGAKLFSLVRGLNYYFWDTVTAAAAIKPELFSFKEMKIDVSTQGKNAGKTSPSIFSGRKIQVATRVEKQGFEDLLLSILRSK